MKVVLKGYEQVKYEAQEKSWECVYDGVVGYEVREIPLEDILEETDGSCVDENNEYLILTFENGDTSTYRNSHVDLFRW